MLVRDLVRGCPAGARTVVRMGLARAWRGGMALAMLVVAGCINTAPVPELQAYASAYQQVQTSGHLLLDEVASIVATVPPEEEAVAIDEEAAPPPRDCRVPSEGVPPCFDPALALSEDGIRINEDPDITIRRAALDVTMEYNSLLLALAEGRSAEGVTQQFGELQTLVTTAAAFAGAPTAGISTLAPAAFSLLNDLAVRFETARAAGTIRESLAASKGDVAELLALLIADTPTIYDIYRSGHEEQLIVLNGELIKAERAGRPEAADLQRQVEGLRTQIRTFHASVGAYTRVLAAARGALDNLVLAAATEGGAIENATAVIRETEAIKIKAEAFFNLIRSVKNPPAGPAPVSPS